MENIIETPVNAGQGEATAPQVQENNTQTQQQTPNSVNIEVAPQQTTQQTPEMNSAFAEMRRAREAAEAKAKKADELISKIYADNGFKSLDDLERAYQESEQQKQRQQYEQAGLNPDLINQLIEKNPAVQQAKQLLSKQQEEQKFNNEASELFKEYPNLNPEDVPPEVFKEREEKGIPLVYTYARYAAKNARTIAEQETIKGLKANAQTSPGALSSAGVDNTPSISNMSKSDFESLLDKIKRGEITSL